MFKKRNLRILLVIAVLIAAVGSFLVLERPTRLVAAPDAPNAVTALTSSTGWVTSYDSAGGYNDISTVTCGDTPGYQTHLSAYVGDVVNQPGNAYVLNWRPNDLGHDMQLCGFRVAYRLPLPEGGFDPLFSYIHVAGAALRPRNSDLEWAYGGYGCVYASEGPSWRILNIHMDIPDGSRIDYLRIYCYRKALVYVPLVIK